MKFIPFLAAASGGALGSVLRYSVSLIPFKGNFPVATLIANLLGALLIGFIAGFTDSKTSGKNIVLFFKTGMCGGFTTFSTFSLESFELLKSGKMFLGTAYILLSVAGCLLGVWAGMSIGKHLE